MNFFAKLKERKLVQWSVAYVAAAFALLQGVGIVAQRLGWPGQTMRFFIIASRDVDCFRRINGP